MDTFSGFMSKDLDASHYSLSHKVTPRTFLNVSQKWSEGMQSQTQSSLIAEEYSGASRLKKMATAASPRELESEANFSGIAKLRTSYGQEWKPLQVDRDETLMGDYEVKRRIMLSGSRQIRSTAPLSSQRRKAGQGRGRLYYHHHQ